MTLRFDLWNKAELRVHETGTAHAQFCQQKADVSVIVEACCYMSVMLEPHGWGVGGFTSALWKLKQTRASSPYWRPVVTAAYIFSHQGTWVLCEITFLYKITRLLITTAERTLAFPLKSNICTMKSWSDSLCECSDHEYYIYISVIPPENLTLKSVKVWKQDRL